MAWAEASSFTFASPAAEVLIELAPRLVREIPLYRLTIRLAGFAVDIRPESPPTSRTILSPVALDSGCLRQHSLAGRDLQVPGVGDEVRKLQESGPEV
jgi:hypothetical protein